MEPRCQAKDMGKDQLLPEGDTPPAKDVLIQPLKDVMIPNSKPCTVWCRASPGPTIPRTPVAGAKGVNEVAD
jgi:hypothetical protein